MIFVKTNQSLYYIVIWTEKLFNIKEQQPAAMQYALHNNSVTNDIQNPKRTFSEITSSG